MALGMPLYLQIYRRFADHIFRGADLQNNFSAVSPQLDWNDWQEIVFQRITGHLKGSLSAYYPNLPNTSAMRVFAERTPHRRRFATIFWIAIVSANGNLFKRLIAKAYCITPRAGSRDQDIHSKSEREYDFHCRVYESFIRQDEMYAVARPVAYIRDSLCLITERAEGIDLGTVIRNTRYALADYNVRKKKLGLHFERCGRWLALFHDSFGQDRGVAMSYEHIEKQLDHYLQRFLRAGGKKEIADPIRQRILGMVKLFEGEPVAHCRLHGDFKLRHIFVTESKITPIDFGNAHEGAALDDLARLLVELNFINFGFGVTLHRELVSYLQKRLLHGYFRSEQWSPLLRLHYIVWLWAKWGRRLKDFTTNAVMKKMETFLRATGLKAALNYGYVNTWFMRELTAELDLLERQI